jgi:hypothetical protein
LARQLADHPQIASPICNAHAKINPPWVKYCDSKELHYFNNDSKRTILVLYANIFAKVEEDREWYVQRFPKQSKYPGAVTSYDGEQ